MKKIPTLFVRDFSRDNGRYVTDEVTAGCEWALAGEGVATRKYDGTCVMVDAAGAVWSRREVKAGKAEPPNFAAIEHDETTGKTVGWEPADQSSFAKFITEAVAARHHLAAGTYELVGPKVNGNPERYGSHELVRHDDADRIGLPLTLDYRTIARTVTDLARQGYEGIVWHHPDGRMAKIKARDFREGVGFPPNPEGQATK